MTESEESQSLLHRITARLAKVSPVRMVLVVSGAYYMIKNAYYYYTIPRPPIPDLPADHEERVAKQSAENMKRAGWQILGICVMVAVVIILKYVNYRNDKFDEEVRKKDEELKKYEEMLEEIREKNKKTKEGATNKKKSKAK